MTKLVDTSDSAELQNCIRNAHECMLKMEQMLEKTDNNKQDLKRLCYEAGILLEEAQQRCEKIL